jgi:drug/metabolite transporter (DMT)-like permease
VVTALIEPALTGARFERHNLVLAILVIPGVALVVGGIPDSMHAGFWIGVASAALAAVFGALNKRFVGHHDAVAVTGIELGAGFLALTVIAAPTAVHGSWLVLPSARDGAWLLVLAILCTLVPFALSLTTLRQLSAFTIQLAINLEPLYAIALAVLFLGEARELDGRFFAGVAIVLAAVLGHAWQQSRQRRRTESLTDEPRSV